MEKRKSKRSVRLALVLGAAVAGTALVGWGGLAAWQAYTQNSGNAFTTGSSGHTNLVSGTGHTACTSTSAEATLCDGIVSGSGLDYNWPGQSNTVKITDTATLPGTFTLSTPADPSGPLCPLLNLEVTGLDSGTPYVNQTGIGPITPTALNNDATVPSATWNHGDSNTFNFAVAPNAGYTATNSIAANGASCTFSVLFPQASA